MHFFEKNRKYVIRPNYAEILMKEIVYNKKCKLPWTKNEVISSISLTKAFVEKVKRKVVGKTQSRGSNAEGRESVSS